MNAFPPYPPGSAPLAPVPSGPGPWPRAFPDGTPASPRPGSEVPEPSHYKGQVHGIQLRGEWEAGDMRGQDLIDEILAPNLWRLTVFGPENMAADVEWGTSARLRINGLALPIRASLPGQLAVRCYPVSAHDDTKLEVRVSVTPATSGGLIEMSNIVTRSGVDVAFDDQAFRFTALVASTLTIRGLAVAVPALSSVRLVAGSVLTGGSGYQEFDG